MKRKLFMVLSVVMLQLIPAMAMAGTSTQDVEVTEARFEGYANQVALTGSTALMWLLVLVLAAACVGVMFIDAKRSHLD